MVLLFEIPLCHRSRSIRCHFEVPCSAVICGSLGTKSRTKILIFCRLYLTVDVVFSHFCEEFCCLLLADCYLPFFEAIGKALEVTPENGMILVFGDSGTHNPCLWLGHFKTSKAKKIKIFWIYTPRCVHSCDAQSLAAYQGLSEGRIYNTASELNINQFFKDAVLTVGKLNLSPFASLNHIL